MISTTKLFFPKYQSLRYFAVRSREFRLIDKYVDMENVLLYRKFQDNRILKYI